MVWLELGVGCGEAVDEIDLMDRNSHSREKVRHCRFELKERQWVKNRQNPKKLTGDWE
jgi:hypothetical protein